MSSHTVSEPRKPSLRIEHVLDLDSGDRIVIGKWVHTDHPEPWELFVAGRRLGRFADQETAWDRLLSLLDEGE